MFIFVWQTNPNAGRSDVATDVDKYHASNDDDVVIETDTR